jgi:hypothetical protein
MLLTELLEVNTVGFSVCSCITNSQLIDGIPPRGQAPRYSPSFSIDFLAKNICNNTKITYR